MSAEHTGPGDHPFAAGHDPRFVYGTSERAEFLARARHGLTSGEPFLLLTGETGVGKTSVITELLEDGAIWAVQINHPRLSARELLEEVCTRFGADLPKKPTKPQMLASLERQLGEIRAAGTAVLVIDEAHALSAELLEELRLLSNLESNGKPLLQIVLVGLPELEATLAQPNLQQLRQRVGVEGRVSALDATETERYLHHRVAAAGGDGPARFPTETCLEIYRLTRGVPRAINTLAGQALLAAERDSATAVTAAHVQAAAPDTWKRDATDEAPQRPVAPDAPAAPAAPTEPSEAATPPEPIGTVIEPRPITDPSVRAWVSRFVDPDKPLQIGSQALAAQHLAELSQGSFDEAFPEGDSGNGEGHAPAAAPRPARKRKKPRGRVLPRDRRRKPRWMTLVGAGAIAIAAVLVIPRLPFRARLKATDVPATATSSTSAPSAAPTPRQTKSKRERSEPSPATSSASSRHATKPKASTPRIVAPAADTTPAVETTPPADTTPAADSSATPRRWQGIEVGTYIDPYRAGSERDRLKGVTGLSARVIQTGGIGAETYHVVLGSFSSSSRASRMADRLVAQGKVDQAQVVPLRLMRKD
jgi:type II secretory pathway predicted ATPase ExeA